MNIAKLTFIITILLVFSIYAQKKDIKVGEFKYDVSTDPDTLMDQSCTFSLSKSSFKINKFVFVGGALTPKVKMLIDGKEQLLKEKEVNGVTGSNFENGSYSVVLKFVNEETSTITIKRKADSFKKTIKVYGWCSGAD